MAVVRVRNRNTNKIAIAPVPETANVRLGHFIDTYVDRDAKKYADENRAYADLPNHKSCNHSVGKYVRGMTHTNGLELFWSVVKRDYDDVSHHMFGDHLHRYVDEFAGSHGIRQ